MAQRRPVEPRSFGPECLEDTNTGQVGCLTCKEAQESSTLTWMKRPSWRAHLNTLTHLKSIKSCEKNRASARESQNQYNALYYGPFVGLQNPAPSHPIPPRPFIGPLTGQDSNGVDAEDFEFTLEEKEQFFGVINPPDIDHETELLRHEIEMLRLAAVEEEFEGADDETIPQGAQHQTDYEELYEEGNDEGIYREFAGVAPTHNYAPYGNKTMCTLDILDNLPRLRMSSSQFKMILWAMRECGARNVPSFKSFRAMQKKIRASCGISTNPHTSDLGNLFYVNDIRDMVAKDFGNPEVSPHIQKYPEDVSGSGDRPISEMWQVKNGRWHEVPLDKLTPSILIGIKRYYIHEIAELQDGRWVIPQMWIDQKGQTHADCYLVAGVESTVLSVATESIVRIPLEMFKNNYEDLTKQEKGPFRFTPQCEEFATRIPNLHRKIDDGEDLFTIWMPVWADDVSGARSKQYQKHINVYMANANLPGRLLQQEYFVRFVSTSPHACALEQLAVVVEQSNSTHVKPVRCYNAATGRPCSFRTLVPDAPADNPQQSEESSHIGHQGNRKCRTCLIGGPATLTESPDGYHAFYAPGEPRNVQEIRACVLEQLRLATYGVASHVKDLQKDTGTKDKIAQHWIEILLVKCHEMQSIRPACTADSISAALFEWLGSQTSQPYNALLDLEFFDVSQDTMVEILHTILLGVEKYTWYDFHSNWTPAQRDTFTIRLQSTNLDGLKVPPIRAAYMMQYRNGLIGKHFKTLMQTMAFHVQDIATADQLTLVKAMGEFGAMVWVASIDNMDAYLADLTILIDNVLDAFANLDPTKILIKIKLHVLVHLIENIRRRGPAVRFSTEVFECFNAIFRMCSVLSNHQAPSRDIALKFADLDRVKHILSGGYWLQDSAWIQAGADVRSLLRKTPILQQHLGWSPEPMWTPGLIKGPARNKRTVFRTTELATLNGSRDPFEIKIDADAEWLKGVHGTAVSGDRFKVGSWVVIRLREDTPMIGHVTDIMLPAKDSDSGQGLVTVEEFALAEALHFKLGMPVLGRRPGARGSGSDPSQQFVVLPSDPLNIAKSVQFVMNVQHDCQAAGCAATGVTPERQERQDTDRVIHSISHKDDGRFIINTHALHNATLLRKFLPRYLTAPRRLFLDGKKRHTDIAMGLAERQQAKRAATKAKTAATKKRKQDAKDAAAANAGSAAAQNGPVNGLADELIDGSDMGSNHGTGEESSEGDEAYGVGDPEDAEAQGPGTRRKGRKRKRTRLTREGM